MTNAVAVSSTSSTSFSFETVKGQHPFYPGTITFSANDVSNGQITFNINVNSSFAGFWSRVGFVLGGGNFESSIWNNLINNIKELCQKSAGKN